MFANLRHINKEVKNNQLEGFNTVLEVSNLTLKIANNNVEKRKTRNKSC